MTAQSNTDLKNKTTISMERETLERLKGLGAMGDTYDSVVNRLIDFYLDHNKDVDKAVRETMQALKKKRFV